MEFDNDEQVRITDAALDAICPIIDGDEPDEPEYDRNEYDDWNDYVGDFE